MKFSYKSFEGYIYQTWISHYLSLSFVPWLKSDTDLLFHKMNVSISSLQDFQT